MSYDSDEKLPKLFVIVVKKLFYLKKLVRFREWFSSELFTLEFFVARYNT